MIVLDTNVLSEVMRPRPDQRVVDWLTRTTDETCITTITITEIFAGLHRLAPSRRKTELSAAISLALRPYLGSRAILPFDIDSAYACSLILAERERAGLPISFADAQIAGICRSESADCATRNTNDFAGTGVRLVNPWES